MNEEPEKAGTKQEIPRNPDGTFPEGVSGNPDGRPKGTKNFSTLLEAAIKKIAEANHIDPESVEAELVAMAITMAKKGNFNYYKDLMDRKYGQPRQKIDMGVDEDIKDITVKIERNAEEPKE